MGIHDPPIPACSLSDLQAILEGLARTRPQRMVLDYMMPGLHERASGDPRDFMNEVIHTALLVQEAGDIATDPPPAHLLSVLG